MGGFLFRFGLRFGWSFALAAGLLAGCGPCLPDRCSLALTAAPGDGAYVQGALGATADQFLGAGSGGAGSGGGAPLLLPLDRRTLQPGSATAFDVARNRGVGLRVQLSRPIAAHTRGFVALRAGTGRHDYVLPQGLGPLTDPARIGFSTTQIGAEIGLEHQRALLADQGLALRLSLAVGHDLTRTRTTVRSALLDVTNIHHEGRAHVTLGTGLVWQPARAAPQVEVRAEARLLQGGLRVLRTEIRLTRPR